MFVWNNVRTAMAKRAAYNRIRNEIESMPQETAIDVGIFREDAEKIAASAVYGK